MPYTRDRAEANGSSIAFVARSEGASVLCAADAHSEVMEASLDRLSPDPHRFTAVKVSHHGSRANLSPGFLERVRSRNWLISTNGAKFGHPSPVALARIVTTQQKPVFHLNYVTEHVEDLIKDAGDRYTLKLPRRRRDGSHQEGITVPLG
jgi:beta-lactamase superfamily II metal-dependent hydrolase